MNRYICERRCDEGMRTFKGGFVALSERLMQEATKE